MHCPESPQACRHCWDGFQCVTEVRKDDGSPLRPRSPNSKRPRWADVADTSAGNTHLFQLAGDKECNVAAIGRPEGICSVLRARDGLCVGLIQTSQPELGVSVAHGNDGEELSIRRNCSWLRSCQNPSPGGGGIAACRLTDGLSECSVKNRLSAKPSSASSAATRAQDRRARRVPTATAAADELLESDNAPNANPTSRAD